LGAIGAYNGEVYDPDIQPMKDKLAK